MRSPTNGLFGASDHWKLPLDQSKDYPGYAGTRNVIAAQFAVLVKIDYLFVAKRGQMLRHVCLLNANEFLDVGHAFWSHRKFCYDCQANRMSKHAQQGRFGSQVRHRGQLLLFLICKYLNMMIYEMVPSGKWTCHAFPAVPRPKTAIT